MTDNFTKYPYSSAGIMKLHWNCNLDLQPVAPIEVHYMKKKSWNPQNTLISFWLKKDMNILNDMGVSKLSGNCIMEVN